MGNGKKDEKNESFNLVEFFAFRGALLSRKLSLSLELPFRRRERTKGKN